MAEGFPGVFGYVFSLFRNRQSHCDRLMLQCWNNFLHQIFSCEFETRGINTGMTAEVWLLHDIFINKKLYFFSESFISPNTLTDPGVISRYFSIYSGFSSPRAALTFAMVCQHAANSICSAQRHWSYPCQPNQCRSSHFHDLQEIRFHPAVPHRTP